MKKFSILILLAICFVFVFAAMALIGGEVKDGLRDVTSGSREKACEVFGYCPETQTPTVTPFP